MSYAIELKGLVKRFGTRTAVNRLDLNIHAGETVGLLGMNGAGKTTTIRMATGLLAPTAGEVLLHGVNIAKDPVRAKSMLGISPQETAVAPKLTVSENLVLMAQLYGIDRLSAHEAAARIMSECGLTPRARDRAEKLSGGMQRRLSIAMCLIAHPSVVFLDEPTLGLDVLARRELWNIIAALKPHTTVVLTTHYLEEAEALCDRIAILHNGSLLALDTPAALMAQTATTCFEDAFLSLTGNGGAL